MTQNQTMHLHKIQATFKSIYKPGNAEIFSIIFRKYVIMIISAKLQASSIRKKIL